MRQTADHGYVLSKLYVTQHDHEKLINRLVDDYGWARELAEDWADECLEIYPLHIASTESVA